MPKKREWFFASSFVAFAVAASILTSYDGSDLEKYDYWAQITVAADINKRTFEPLAGSNPGELSDYTSVNGVQFKHWSAGPGLFVAAFRLVLTPFGWQQKAVVVAAALSVAVFWWLFFVSLERLWNASAALLGVALAYAGTGLGFYSCYPSLELYSLLPMGLLLNEATKQLKGDRGSPLVIGAATGMLLMFRSYLGAYAWFALLPAACSCVRSRDADHATSTLAARIFGLCLLLLPIGAAVWQIGSVHEWMTGSFTQSPYNFGDEQFRSIDAASPYWRNVLFSPFHGAFASSPLTAIGLVLAIFFAGQAIVRKAWNEAAFWSLLLAASACNAYVAGCWHNWWMAAWFGNRNLYLLGVVAVLAVVKALRETNGWTRSLLALACGVATLWSFLLLQRGRVSYERFDHMVLDLPLDFAYWTSPEMGGMAALSFVLAFIAVANCGKADKPPPAQSALSVLAAGLTLCYLIDRITLARPDLPLLYSAVAAALAASLMRLNQAAGVTRPVAPVLLLAMLLLFARLFVATLDKTHKTPGGISYPAYDVEYNIRSTKGVGILAKEREQMLQFLRRELGDEWHDSYRETEAELPPVITRRNHRGQKQLRGYRYL